ncbi:thioesterase domain-containing protein, partial [Bacillus velezensis]
SYFIQLEKMPLTSNGKIDRKALPLPDGNIQTGVKYIAPRTSIELKLAEIWKGILVLKQIGIHDNFFHIGGDSLKVLKLIQSIKEHMDAEISFQTVFQAQTIELLAINLMNGKIKLEDETKFTPLTYHGNTNVFCFPSRIGIGMTYIEMAKLLERDCRIYTTDFIDNYTNYDDMICEYVENIIQIQEQGPYVFLGYSGGGNIAFEVAKEMENKGLEVSDIIMLDTTLWNAEVNERVREMFAEVQHDYTNVPEWMTTKYIQNKINKFTMYLNQLTNTGVVNSNIHNVVIDNSMSKFKKEWVHATSKCYKEYEGYGTHDEILEPEFIDENIGIVKGILKNIKHKSAMNLV